MANKLTMEGATVGYDKEGFSTMVKNVKVNVLKKARDQLKKSLDDLNTSVDQIWVGKSAGIFKDNMKKDVDAIVSALKRAEVVFDTEMTGIERSMANIDAALVKKK